MKSEGWQLFEKLGEVLKLAKQKRLMRQGENRRLWLMKAKRKVSRRKEWSTVLIGILFSSKSNQRKPFNQMLEPKERAENLGVRVSGKQKDFSQLTHFSKKKHYWYKRLHSFFKTLLRCCFIVKLQVELSLFLYLLYLSTIVFIFYITY